jgi:hypothetical protein
MLSSKTAKPKAGRPQNPQPTKPKAYLTAPQLQVRYGNRSDMWLTRIMERDPKFPRPIQIGRHRLWDVDQIEQYECECAARRQQGEAIR